jgi:hypothetical protein
MLAGQIQSLREGFSFQKENENLISRRKDRITKISPKAKSNLNEFSNVIKGAILSINIFFMSELYKITYADMKSKKKLRYLVLSNSLYPLINNFR